MRQGKEVTRGRQWIEEYTQWWLRESQQQAGRARQAKAGQGRDRQGKAMQGRAGIGIGISLCKRVLLQPPMKLAPAKVAIALYLPAAVLCCPRSS